MKVRILGGGRIVPGLGEVHVGAVLDVAEEMGAGLCAQGMAVAVVEKTKTAVSSGKPLASEEKE